LAGKNDPLVSGVVWGRRYTGHNPLRQILSPGGERDDNQMIKKDKDDGMGKVRGGPAEPGKDLA
jgi:hypothetical protein